MSQDLAILGGTPIRMTPFPKLRNIGEEEKKAVNEVLDDDNLSGFAGFWSDRFYGGPRVQKLERAWEEYFHVKHPSQ